jgi:NADH-quinone oxidoreductase subunit K
MGEATVGLGHWLALSAVLLAIGAVGVVVRRNVLILFMCIELMLNAANLAFVAGARSLGRMDGQTVVFFVMTVAAAEAAVGLAVILALFRNRQTVAADEIALLKW